jgi:tRNA-dihydrouridine synthase B
MRIGNLLLKNKVSLAPMAGITNLPFRTLLKDFGCALTFTEMISANGLIRNSTRSFEYLSSSPADKPLSVQLFGSEPFVIAEAAKIVAGQGADLIDINMGCPARKIVRTGAGSALLKNPLQVGNIIRTVRRAVSVPLTVKIRSGCNVREINALEVARIAEDCGADAVVVHPRTADQGFGGRADWDLIKEIKRGVKIPVIGNGDIRHAADALRMINHTGCDGVMVGRGALGNPWLIGEIIACLADRDLPDYPSLLERGKIIARHLEMELQYYGEACGSRNFRKHLLWYTKSLPGGAKFRQLAVNLKEKESILNELQRFFLSCPD